MSRETKVVGMVRCLGLIEGHTCGVVCLTDKDYDRQLLLADKAWMCPLCGAEGVWIDAETAEGDGA